MTYQSRTAEFARSHTLESYGEHHRFDFRALQRTRPAGTIPGIMNRAPPRSKTLQSDEVESYSLSRIESADDACYVRRDDVFIGRLEHHGCGWLVRKLTLQDKLEVQRNRMGLTCGGKPSAPNRLADLSGKDWMPRKLDILSLVGSADYKTRRDHSRHARQPSEARIDWPVERRGAVLVFVGLPKSYIREKDKDGCDY